MPVPFSDPVWVLCQDFCRVVYTGAYVNADVIFFHHLATTATVTATATSLARLHRYGRYYIYIVCIYVFLGIAGEISFSSKKRTRHLCGFKLHPDFPNPPYLSLSRVHFIARIANAPRNFYAIRFSLSLVFSLI